MSWLDALARCGDMGAVPFVPKTPEDFQMMKSVRLALGDSYCLWLAASDLAEEGVLRWWDGRVVTGLAAWDWLNGEEMHNNAEGADCLCWRSQDANNNGLYMAGCGNPGHPMICYKED
ncbi:unnamed protein product [Meganyctiphanes norvegica]|uniref:C-type lectin domain-containing protein n=1 Tax=Meganyctiphanes norvegica TaxID=48144 RepID=A0AAV2QP58_MEGNR